MNCTIVHVWEAINLKDLLRFYLKFRVYAIFMRMYTGGIFQRNVNWENLWHGEEGLRPWILQVCQENHHKQKPNTFIALQIRKKFMITSPTIQHKVESFDLHNIAKNTHVIPITTNNKKH